METCFAKIMVSIVKKWFVSGSYLRENIVGKNAVTSYSFLT